MFDKFLEFSCDSGLFVSQLFTLNSFLHKKNFHFMPVLLRSCGKPESIP